jgi:uncharacterized protein (TIGR04255 family)
MAKNKVVYKRNFLDNVILRIDFEKIDLSKLADFSKALSKEYPYQETKKGLAGEVHIDIQNNVVNNNRQEVSFWEYTNAYRNKKARIASDHLLIEYQNKSYNDSQDLLNDVKEFIQPFIDEFSVHSVTRVGLRYINRFDFNSEVKGQIDWKNYFSNELIAGITFSKKLKHSFARLMSQSYFKLDGCDILMNYGIWNQDFPNTNVSKEFVLDIDCFSRFPLEKTSDISKTITEYNKSIQAIFEKSIKQGVKDIMQNAKRK